MSSINRVFVMGNLTKDPETKQLQSGTVVGDLRLAISESYTNQQGEKKESVCYIDIVVWGKQAELCKQYLVKGSPVIVEGRLQYDTWEKDGQKRSIIKVRADNVQFLGSPNGKRRDNEEEADPESSASSGKTAKSKVKQLSEISNEDEDEPPF
jgi:single-strand DNA-binding protein